MFPPLICVPAAIMNFTAVYFTVQVLRDRDSPLLITWRGTAGALSTVLFFLLMRVYDELKDVETDLKLGRAGDPRYKDRAIVTGRIQINDLRALRSIVTGGLVAINLPLGFPLPLAAFTVVFALTWCSFHWFFWPRMSQYLLVAFVTHNPLTVALGAYAAAISISDFGNIGNIRTLIVLLVGIWTPLAAWETSRKIRIKTDETEDRTYSKVLGWRVAGIVPGIFAVVSVACMTSVAVTIGLSWIYSAAALTVAGLFAAACLRFEFWPSRFSAHFAPTRNYIH